MCLNSIPDVACGHGWSWDNKKAKGILSVDAMEHLERALNELVIASHGPENVVGTIHGSNVDLVLVKLITEHSIPLNVCALVRNPLNRIPSFARKWSVNYDMDFETAFKQACMTVPIHDKLLKDTGLKCFKFEEIVNDIEPLTTYLGLPKPTVIPGPIDSTTGGEITTELKKLMHDRLKEFHEVYEHFGYLV